MVSTNYLLSLLVFAPLLVQAQPTNAGNAALDKRESTQCYGSGHWGYISDVVAACKKASSDFSNKLVGKDYPMQITYGPYNTGSGRKAVVDIRAEYIRGNLYDRVRSNDITYACKEIVQKCRGNNQDTRGGSSVQSAFKIYVDVNACNC
ncbi:hypothetical protein BCV72DRAFT_230642 [Rhizopus microsporus var. microsporus]|uniref:Uncharacterized protein n=2 Tax=Rhizopus microsporus TaxID=58291 RepID=A0A2G4SFM4_RHIZD|nr:uncharacterized protein RHIMIDRAFT_274379 [Rhizopus microsporus ATCC 52813]ORE05036.1 hypothetical protein BCV72DRAFT_230642 [Rhizopus microsporus var. microsporus]PHZ07559.1 hypothetical protein RHIMIDRAFT_274379 [Rhizopus microsporus ATCC 52813]